MKSISKGTIKVLQLLTVFVMLAGAVFPPTVVAHAQDVVPPAPEQTAEPPADESPAEAAPEVVVPPEQTVEAPAADPTEVIPAEQTVEAPVEVVPTEPVLPLEQTVVAPTEVPTEVVPVTGGTGAEGEAEEEPTEDLGAIVAALEESNTVLVNENDEEIPLASEEAAEVLAGADPFFRIPGTNNYVGFTSGTSCTYTWITECHNNLTNPVHDALADTRLADGATVYIEGNTSDADGGKLYNESVTINKAITLQAGNTFTRNSGNGNVSVNKAGYATINSITLQNDLTNIGNVFANGVIVTASGDAVKNGKMLEDALTLIRSDKTITLGAGTYKDETNGFEITKDKVTLEGAGDATIIDGASGSGGNGILVNADNVKIKKLKVINSYDGIEIDEANGTDIDNVTLTSNHTGLHITDNAGHTNSINYSNIFGNEHYGIYNEISLWSWDESYVLDATNNYWGPTGLRYCWKDMDECRGPSNGSLVWDYGTKFNINVGSPSGSYNCPAGQTLVGGACVDIVRGCTNSAYMEYNAAANVDDGSCHTLKVYGCTNPAYLEYNAAANVDNGTCHTLKVVGCMDSNYLEYNASANVSNPAMCVTPKVVGCMDSNYLEYNPSANVSNPALCVTAKVVGCMDSNYLEYNASANVSNPALCVTPKVVGCMNSGYLEYNPSANVNDPAQCVTAKVYGCMNDDYLEYNPAANSDDGTCLTPKVVGCKDSAYLEYNALANVSDPSMCVTPKVEGCMDPAYIEYNPAANTDNGTCVTPKVVGCMDGSYMEYNAAANVNDPAQCVTPKVYGCMNSEYMEYNASANVNDPAQCVTPKVYGCMNSEYMEYNASANVSDPTQCVTPKVYGCMDSDYVEYDPAANSDDGTCATLKVFGCTDSDYVEYNAAANTDNGTCATLKVYGCTDSDYVEYNPAANTDNGTCSTLKVFGCTNSEYMEYDAAANTDDGTCVTPKVYGCMNDDYLEYNPEANSDNGTCTTLKVYGCMDNTYVEYNSKANVDDGSCEVKKVYGCTDEDYMEYNSKANTDDGSCEVLKVFGCTDPGRDGYDPEANVDDGESCGRKLSCPAGFYDGDANGTCDHTDCKPGFNDLNSDGKCVATVCAPGTNDDDADGYCEDDDVVENPGGPNGGPFGTYNVAGGNGVIPVTGGMNQLSCTDANTLVLANGNSVGFSAPMCGYSAGLNEDNAGALPAPLPTGYGFASGMTLNVTKGNDPATVLPDPVTDTLTFVVPDELKDKTFTILYWDAAANGGLGKWIEIPAKIMKDGKVVSAPLAAGDEREVVSGVEITALLTGEATLNFTGTFVLAYK